MKIITDQATNKINIIGRANNIVIREGKTKDNKNYISGTLYVDVNQSYLGDVQEESQIGVQFFSTALTTKGTANPAYESLQKLRELKTIQTVGNLEADTVRISGANLAENLYIAKNSNQLVDTWVINASFINVGKGSDIATFCVDAYIMEKTEELDREGNETGRLIVRAGVVQYGGRLDIIEFIAEDAMAVEHVSRNWDIDTTVQIKGRIRATTKEVVKKVEATWGEVIPEGQSTRIVRELIITSGSEGELDEEMSYDSVDIRKAFAERKARIEQLRVSAQESAQKTSTKKSSYGWEE